MNGFYGEIIVSVHLAGPSLQNSLSWCILQKDFILRGDFAEHVIEWGN